MRKKTIHVKLLALSLMSGAALFCSCNDNDYEFGEIDTTIGIGGDKLEIPVSSTDIIKLADVLELENSDCIVEAENGDYMFQQKGEEVAPVAVTIAPITLNSTKSNVYDIPFSSMAASNSTRAISAGLKAQGKAFDFDYKYTKPAEVVNLEESEVDTYITLKTTLPSGLPSIDKLTLTFPKYMIIKEGNGYQLKDNAVTFTDVTSGTKTVAFSKIDFTQGGSNITVQPTTIEMKGAVDLEAEVSQIPSSFPASANLKVEVSLGNIQLKTATGYFKPTINLTDLGNVSISSVPDFLKGGNVNVDLYNPQITLSVDNNMDVEGVIAGIITAYKDNKQTAQVKVENIKIAAGKTSKICICRNATGITGYDQVIAVPTLSTLIGKIPDRLTFAATAEANEKEKGSFEFGKQYLIKPAYSVEAPIAFAENAVIEYKDTLDGWNDDLEDLRLAENSYLLATATVENGVPAYLSVEAIPVDVNHQPISSDELDVIVDGNIAASKDGKTTVNSPLSVKLVQKKEDAVKKLDGIVFLVSGKANGTDGAVTGITLNSQKHSLKLKDVKIQLVGRVISNFN